MLQSAQMCLSIALHSVAFPSSELSFFRVFPTVSSHVKTGERTSVVRGRCTHIPSPGDSADSPFTVLD